MPKSDDQQPDLLSKTQRKKDMQDLQELGKKLMELSAAQLANIPLSPELTEAIQTAKRLKSNEAKRRLLQFIGKKMREVDSELVRTELKKVLRRGKKHAAQFPIAEQWQDQLIAEGDQGLQNFLTDFPDADRQKLRQLIRKTQHDIAKEKETGGKVQLFKYLCEIVKK